MAEVKIDEELLEIAMDFTQMATLIEGILERHQRSSAILNSTGNHPTTMYEGRAREKLEQAVQAFGTHIYQLAEYYNVCHVYVRYVWEEMKALDEQIATKMEYQYIFANADALGVDIPKGAELPDDFVTNEDYVVEVGG